MQAAGLCRAGRQAALALGLSLAALGALSASAAPAPGPTRHEAAEFHRAWTLENWDDGGALMRYVFLHMPQFWPHALIHRHGKVRPLPEKLRPEVAAFATRTRLGRLPLAEYVRRANVNGALVLHRGAIVFEAYPRMRRQDKHLLMSVSKVLASTLIARLEDRRLIDVRKPVDSYLPALAGSGWQGVPVIDVLDMASGIHCPEFEDGAYDNPARCYYQFEAALGWLRATAATAPSAQAHIASLRSHRPPGTTFEYTSPNTFVLSWLAEQVTGQPYAELLSQEIWQPMGAESDALMAAPRHGTAVAHGGVSATLRDLARLGGLFTPSGRRAGYPGVSDATLRKIQSQGRPGLHSAAQGDTAPGPRLDGERARFSTYQWDQVMRDGDFFKAGFGGQGLYVSPSRDLVVAFFGSFDKEPADQNQLDDVARQLAKSGLFARAPAKVDRRASAQVSTGVKTAR